MAEITPIDPREGTNVVRIPKIADIGQSLMELQKPNADATIDGSGYVLEYLQDRESRAQDVTGGQQAMFYADEATVSEVEQARKESLIRQLDAGEITMEKYKENYSYQRPINYGDLLERGFDDWLDHHLDPRHEASRGAIMAQLKPTYIEKFQEKFLTHQREYKKQVVHNDTTNAITMNQSNGSNAMHTGYNTIAFAEHYAGELKKSIANGIATGNPLTPMTINEEYMAIAKMQQQGEDDLTLADNLFAQSEGLIAGATMYHVFAPNDTEANTKNNSYAYQGSKILAQLSAMHAVQNAIAGDQFDAMKIAMNEGVKPEDINSVGREAGKDYDLTGLYDALPDIVDGIGYLPEGMDIPDQMALGEAFINGLENKMKTADDVYDRQSTELAEVYSNYSWDIMMNAKLDTGGLLMQTEKDAAQALINNMQMSVAREEMKGSDADPIIARLKSAIDYVGDDETPGDVKIGLYMAGLEEIITMLQSGKNQMDFRGDLWKNAKYVDGNGETWNMSDEYSIWHEIQEKISLMGPWNDLWDEAKKLINQTNDPVKAQTILETAFFESTQLYQGTYGEDVATSHVLLASMDVERDQPRNRDFKPGGDIVFKINTGEVLALTGNKSEIMNSIQDIGNFDKEYLGSMLNDDGFVVPSHYDMYWDAYSNAGFNDDESSLMTTNIGGNTLGRSLGFDDRDQPIVAVRSGEFVTTMFGGQAVDAYKVDVFDIIHNKLPNSIDLDPDSPALRLHGGRQRGREINYYMVQNPQTKTLELWTGVVQTGTHGRQKAVTLGDSISVSMGLNGDLMSHLHNSGVEGGQDIVTAQQTLETDANLTMYVNWRESNYIDPDVQWPDTDPPQAVITADEKYAPLPTAYEYVSKFYGSDEYVPPVKAVREAIVGGVLASPEEARYRNLSGFFSKADLEREEEASGGFVMPTQSWRPQYTSDIDREGNRTTVPEGFTDTEYTEEYGPFVRVPREIAGEVRMLYFSGEPGSVEEAFELYEFYNAQKRQGGLR